MLLKLLSVALMVIFKLFITPEAKQEIDRNSRTPDPLAELVKNIPMLPSYVEIEKTEEYNTLKQKYLEQ